MSTMLPMANSVKFGRLDSKVRTYSLMAALYKFDTLAVIQIAN